MQEKDLCRLSATEIREEIRSDALSAEEITQAALERIAARDDELGAFQSVCAEDALNHARKLDQEVNAGRNSAATQNALFARPLLGVPIAAKDIIDTEFAPTGWGSPIYTKRRPLRNAACIELLRKAGAIIIGKTVTTEFAYFHPGKTVNPHHHSHTPGGSSSGSAAAVADAMVPLALGTQTAGSIIRPASYCGVMGYKPSFGEFPLEGIMNFAPSLDTLGLFSRNIADLVCARASLKMAPMPPASSPEQFKEKKGPKITLLITEEWDSAAPQMQNACLAALERLASKGARAQKIKAPASINKLVACQKQIMAFEAARTRIYEFHHHREQLSAAFTALLNTGLSLSGSAYHHALLGREQALHDIAPIMDDCDIILCPSAIDEAPRELNSTGDPLFNRSWTLLGFPCLSMPYGQGKAGLPLAIQLIGKRWQDDRLLALAAWCAEKLPCIIMKPEAR